MRTSFRYSFAVAMTVTAVLATVAMADLIAPMRLFFLWCAVLISAVVAGPGPAAVSVALSVAAALFFVFEPRGAFALHTAQDAIRLTLFTLFASGISYAVGLRRAAERRASALSKELRSRELRYRTLVEGSPVPQAVWTATPDGRIEWSDEWMAITGRSREELQGDSRRIVHPDDAPRTWARWSDALANGTMYQDEIRVRTAGGRDRWFAIQGVPVRDAEGRIVEWIGSTADIDDRKRHEEHALFINRASEVLGASLVTDEALHNLARLAVPTLGDWCAIDLVREGDTYERVVVEHRDPSRVRLLHELEKQGRPAPDRDPLVAVMRSGKPQLVEELTDAMLDAMLAALATDPRRAELARGLGVRSWIIAPMIARGRTLGALTVATGESGRRYSEEDVPVIADLASRAAMAIDNARLYEEAEAANRAKDEFLATLSHELRTPLTAIAGWAHLLQLGISDDDTRRVAVDTILRSAKSQGELIDDLLDLSRVVAGTLHLDIATVDLNRIAGEVVQAAMPAAEAKGIALRSEHAREPLLVRGDDRRLRQILWNLVSNAVKFTREGAVSVSLTRDDGMARVSVTDTGAGVDSAFLPFVWDRFRQGDSSTSRQYGGLGLGLAVVRHLVELHGGTVQATSPGRGSGATFSFAIPLARLHEGAAASISRNDDGRAALRGRRVLVVDDDTDARVVLGAMLEQVGAAVTSAASVDEAVALLQEHAFDAIVSDIAMPGQDGYALVRHVRDMLANQDIPMIAVSAIGTGADDRRRALDAGFTEFLRKPVEPHELTNAVRGVVR